MAVLSRPSLRSSVRKGADPGPPATDEGNSRRGKRTRDSSLGNESNASSKKLRSDCTITAINVTPASTKKLFKSLPIRDRHLPIKAEGTQRNKPRKLDPVLVPVRPRINGSTHLGGESDGLAHIGINQNISLTASQADQRSLRSHDGGSRSKSELEPYFSNYDELISIEPKEPGCYNPPQVYISSTDNRTDLVTPETMLHIFDEPTKSTATNKGPPFHMKSIDGGQPSSFTQTNGTVIASRTIQWPEETFTTLNNATRIELPALDHRVRKNAYDPLDDSVYLKVHAREERKEKQLRNIEKERAMHEKFQLERLLDGLKGHDWLRVMGISGITDSEKRAYEPKRDHLMHEVRSLLDKFRLWKEEEKRRKAEKEEIKEDEDEENEDEEEDDVEEIEDVADDGANDDALSDGDPPDYSDVDESAARQLRMEAVMATRAQMGPGFLAGPTRHPPPKPPPPLTKPFTSFYEKPYMRAAALGKHRRSGRSRMAFGQPIPEVDERYFDLPKEVKTTEALLESGRRIRRSKRESREV